MFDQDKKRLKTILIDMHGMFEILHQRMTLNDKDIEKLKKRIKKLEKEVKE